ncbi:hypothetical protein E4T42_05821 [Aureobasidium subglaciale]|nr:hypothetical protein E4T42_05821 [Aureobasidium subglaciale]
MNSDFDCTDDCIEPCERPLRRFLKVYMMADRYDCPTIRRAVVPLVNEQLEEHISPHVGDSFQDLSGEIVQIIAELCGPDSPQLADPSLRRSVFDWLSYNFAVCIQESSFRSAIGQGILLDARLTATLLLKLGKQIKDSRSHSRERSFRPESSIGSSIFGP